MEKRIGVLKCNGPVSVGELVITAETPNCHPCESRQPEFEKIGN
jgi:hypothetical protein